MPAGALFASSLCVPESADGDIAPDDAVTAQAGALFDVTDSSVIYGKNIYDQMYPASITKVMTAIIAIEDKRFYEHNGVDATGIAAPS